MKLLDYLKIKWRVHKVLRSIRNERNIIDDLENFKTARFYAALSIFISIFALILSIAVLLVKLKH